MRWSSASTATVGEHTCAAPWPATRGWCPVAKGNGYGFGLGRLARKSQWLGVDTLAVGTYEELPEVAKRFDGSLLVLTPWRPGNALPEDPPGGAHRRAGSRTSRSWPRTGGTPVSVPASWSNG